jgi:hypothetical protein
MNTYEWQERVLPDFPSMSYPFGVREDRYNKDYFYHFSRGMLIGNTRLAVRHRKALDHVDGCWSVRAQRKHRLIWKGWPGCWQFQKMEFVR